MSTSPGTSPNQARNSRFAAGNDKMGSAPASSISRLTDQIHRPVLAERVAYPHTPIVGRPCRLRQRSGMEPGRPAGAYRTVKVLVRTWSTGAAAPEPLSWRPHCRICSGSALLAASHERWAKD